MNIVFSRSDVSIVGKIEVVVEEVYYRKKKTKISIQEKKGIMMIINCLLYPSQCSSIVMNIKYFRNSGTLILEKEDSILWTSKRKYVI